ncbi:MAG: hypothetical protein P8P74_03770 [Crocinitomicaceae bacterium]|nr:hypothetical protein [Crocinitomicaceae bacterium]
MRVLIFLFALLILGSCSDDSVSIERGVYFWENDTEKLTAENTAALDSLKIEKLYVKIFEVDRENEKNKPIAKSSLKLKPKNLKNRELIPCIFILNKVFVESSREELDELVSNIVGLTNKFFSEKLTTEGAIDFSEIQIDCDWSEKSKGNYFYFLRKVKEESKKEISCTLRLYPYKFHEKMGVPPVDRATLMCYNLLNPVKNPRKNTILDTDEMSKYLDTKIDYGVPLDVALPVYSWMQCYDRDYFKGVIHGPIEQYSDLVTHDRGLWYTMKQDTVISTIYVRKGDRIKMERVSNDDLSKAVDLIKASGILKNDAVLSYFHLTSQELKFYSYEKLNSYSSSLSD